MNMENYKPNSHKSREVSETRKVPKVVSGSVKQKKKNEMQKFADVFISEDAANVKSYILLDVLVPAVKKAISDIVTNGIDMILYGETGKSKKSSSASKISYRNYYDRQDDNRDYRGGRAIGNLDYDNLSFESRGDAEAVLNAMEDIISQYGVVSVGDLYDLAGFATTNYTVNKYGWTDIRSARVVRYRDEYFLKLPRALPLN
jgi:hypothetical protein